MDEPRDPLTANVIGAAIEVHKALGPGLLESVYEQCLAIELSDRGVRFERQVPVPVVFKGRRLDQGYRLDFLVEDQLILELKAAESLLPVMKPSCSAT